MNLTIWSIFILYIFTIGYGKIILYNSIVLDKGMVYFLILMLKTINIF